MNFKIILRAYIIVILGLTGCGKEFLDIKRNANQVVPHTVRDYLALMNNSSTILRSSNAYAFFGSDEYYVEPNALASLSKSSPHSRQVYIWGDDTYLDETQNADWNFGYSAVMTCNLALDVEKILPNAEELDDWNRTRLAARYHRAWSFYQLAQLFCPVFDENTVEQELGLPLRLDYDLAVKYQRATLKETYDQILKDLHEAEEIPVLKDDNIFLPGPLAVKALLARIYLQMGRYDLALQYADKVLKEKNELLDFNRLSGTVVNEGGSYLPPYGRENPEVILYMNGGPGNLVGSTRFNAAPEFLDTFETGDLRGKIYFFKRANGTKMFVGSYSGRGGANLFSGPAVDEMLLIRAECLARDKMVSDALQDINRLRSKRYEPVHFKEIKDSEVNDVVELVLKERKKELYMRGLRWEDARRLNREGVYSVTFSRELEGEVFQLKPGSKKWAWPLPPNEISRSGLVQNSR